MFDDTQAFDRSESPTPQSALKDIRSWTTLLGFVRETKAQTLFLNDLIL